MDTYNNTYTNFPAQTSNRTKKFYKKCIDEATKYINTDYHGIRSTHTRKIRNYNLINDIFDPKDVTDALNPLGVNATTFPKRIQHYPIAVQKIDLLSGEEQKRKFEFTARVVNDDAISSKEEAKDKELDDFLIKTLQAKYKDPKELEQALADKMDYLNYSWQDVREKMANQLLVYYFKHLDMKSMFSSGFVDLLTVGEELYCSDIVGGEPIIRKMDPLKVHAIGGNHSPFIEDSDIIIEDTYQSVGWILDNYYDVLTPAEVKRLESGSIINNEHGKGSFTMGRKEPPYIMVNELMDNFDLNNLGTGEPVNINGEIRVVRVVWKSRKKVLLRTYFDETGEPQQDIVHSDYEKNETEGDIDLKPIFVNEWLEGTRIGDEHTGLYVKMQPRPIQFRKIDNFSKCGPGITGVYANVNSNRAMSLMDRMFPYQVAYNLYMNKLNLLFAKYKGVMYDMDFSQIPDDYSVEEWMYYADILGWKMRDPFNEGQSGVGQGKLAGHMNQPSGHNSANISGDIQQVIEMLKFIEEQLGSISGISKAREGQIHNSQAVNNVTREINQSSHITEKWFSLHDQVRRKALEMFLETAKHSFRNKNRKAQYILDDTTTQVLKIEGEILNEADYGIQITNSANIEELFNSLKQLAHAGIQNDKITFTQLMDIYTDSSISSIKRKIESAEKKKIERDREQLQSQEKMKEMEVQGKREEKLMDHDHELLKQANEIEKDINLKLMDLQMKASERDLNEKELEIKQELEKMKLDVEKQKVKAMEKRQNSTSK